MLASTRAYQSGAGVGGIISQSAPPLAQNAVRDPRVGIAYSLADTLRNAGFGLRLGSTRRCPSAIAMPLPTSVSFVVMPSATLAFQHRALRMNAELGARFRRAVDFGGRQLGHQGFLALGVAVDLLPPGWLVVSLEAFAFPPFLPTAAARRARCSVKRGFFRQSGWRPCTPPSAATARGRSASPQAAAFPCPVKRATPRPGQARVTSWVWTTPDFRSLLVVRFAPAK